jgi:peptidoglycan hydrolase-like protein with peptidoglycan-binding domain
MKTVAPTAATLMLAGALATLGLASLPGTAAAQVPESWWSQELPPDAMRQALPDVQAKLKTAGCYAGQVDGKYGPQTRRAIEGWQRMAGVPATGIVSEPLVQGVGTMNLRCTPTGRATRG